MANQIHFIIITKFRDIKIRYFNIDSLLILFHFFKKKKKKPESQRILLGLISR